MLMIYSMSGICSKLAAGESFLSFRFCLYYAAIIGLLGFYAVGWQQIIKRIPLTTAFANKAVTVAWGLVWGFLFFHEKITPGKVIGALLVIAGVVVYAIADQKDQKDAQKVETSDVTDVTGKASEQALLIEEGKEQEEHD